MGTSDNSDVSDTFGRRISDARGEEDLKGNKVDSGALVFGHYKKPGSRSAVPDSGPEGDPRSWGRFGPSLTLETDNLSDGHSYEIRF
jgi:hypothetical protein